MKLTERLASLRGHDDNAPPVQEPAGGAPAGGDPAAAHPAGGDRRDRAAERLRSDAVATEIDPFSADPSEARVHITADAELVIDLRPAAVVGGPAATTDMPCPNCQSALRVDSLDAVSRRATMSCRACGFHFSQRLTAAGR